MDKPTFEKLRAVWREDDDGDDIDLVHDRVTGSWRHGSEHEAVFKRRADGTFWLVAYRADPGGDYNDFRDETLDVAQVWPHTVTSVEYKSTPPPAEALPAE
ncbi:hypothetical protein GIW81_00970 [Hyphomicrobium sp. xq]|uniref:Uncharacterized protein n=1 Tax=Hyphomicrobium album TaxID=2665159 RepID=A0A6I3KFY3_9HYPH|nr:hypothetical protein [Hyphomicrobium album]MTD92900.1 hypothetical protein [Hyphomicrobium album]